MAKVLYRKDKKIYFFYPQVNGVRKYHSLGKNRRQAEILAKKIEGQYRRNPPDEDVLGEEVTLKELANLFLDFVQQNRAEATYVLRRRYIVRFLNYMGPCYVSDITRAKFGAFAAWARKDATSGNAREYIRSAKAMLRWGQDEEVCKLAFTKFPAEPSSSVVTRRFTREQVLLLLEETDGEFRDAVKLGLLTGLRATELINLEWENVKVSARGGTYLHLEAHKTSRTARVFRPRTTPLSAEAEAVIQRQRERHGDSVTVFLNDKGKPYTSSAFRNRFIRACKKAGVPEHPPTSLRHTYASLQAELGYNQISLAALLGHTNVRTTARYVSHTDEYFQGAVDKLEEALFSDSPEGTGMQGGDKKCDQSVTQGGSQDPE